MSHPIELLATNEDLTSWGIEDAEETFRDEQLVYWYDQSLTSVAEPRAHWLSERLHREPMRLQWQRYRNSYIGALHAAMRMLDKLWDEYIEAVENPGAGMNEVIQCENDVTYACCAAMQGDKG